MKTKTTFTLDNENLTNGFQKAFNWMQESKVIVASPKGKEYLKTPLLLALVATIIFPLLPIAAIILTLTKLIKISIEQEVNEKKDDIKRLGAHIN